MQVPLAGLVRAMNCYYSNLIEGHDTHPIDIERALKNDYSQDRKKRDLQLEAKAHVAVQQWIDEGGLSVSRAVSSAGVVDLHRRFCEHLPEDLCQGHLKPRADLLRTGTDFQISRRGEDQRFRNGPLRVPAGVLRDRPADILGPQALAKRHDTYRYRVLIGPTYRADMWALLDREPSLSASELARKADGSFSTAWQVKHDRALIGGCQLDPVGPQPD
jgi:hypothetical protein